MNRYPHASGQAVFPKFFTPVRKLLFRTDTEPASQAVLGKRIRGNDDEEEDNEHAYQYSDPDPVVATPTTPVQDRDSSAHGSLPDLATNSNHVLTCSRFSNAPHRKACIALQTHDLDEDAVVITTLQSYPFCCHEDLLTMSRIQLVAAAESLNRKLPRLLRIDVGDSRSEASIRDSIEVLVDLRVGSGLEVPGAPKAERAKRDLPRRPPRLDEELNLDAFLEPSLPSPMPSPAGRRRDVHAYPGMTMTPKLARLEEEEEEVERPIKKRRVRVNVLEEDDDTHRPPATPTPRPRLAKRRASYQAQAQVARPVILRSLSQSRHTGGIDLEREPLLGPGPCFLGLGMRSRFMEEVDEGIVGIENGIENLNLNMDSGLGIACCNTP